jgi:hypothetical protein
MHSTVDVSPLLSPVQLAEQAVDLNLRLMRWRAAPELDVAALAATRCLLLGACVRAWVGGRVHADARGGGRAPAARLVGHARTTAATDARTHAHILVPWRHRTCTCTCTRTRARRRGHAGVCGRAQPHGVGRAAHHLCGRRHGVLQQPGAPEPVHL